jgi:hypothetical protein
MKVVIGKQQISGDLFLCHLIAKSKHKNICYLFVTEEIQCQFVWAKNSG